MEHEICGDGPQTLEEPLAGDQFAPRGTPRDLVMRIRDDVAAVLQLPDVRQRLLDIGGEPGGQTPEEFAARVRSEIAMWQKVAVAAGIKPQ